MWNPEQDAPRPDLSDLTPKLIEVVGRFNGFRLKKRSIFIDSEESPILTHWEFDEQLASVLDLAKNPKSLRKFFIHEAIDQRGQPIYSLPRWSDFQCRADVWPREAQARLLWQFTRA